MPVHTYIEIRNGNKTEKVTLVSSSESELICKIRNQIFQIEEILRIERNKKRQLFIAITFISALLAPASGGDISALFILGFGAIIYCTMLAMLRFQDMISHSCTNIAMHKEHLKRWQIELQRRAAMDRGL